MRRASALAIAVLAGACRSAGPGSGDLPKVWAQADREQAGLGDADFSDPAAWRFVHADGRDALELFGASDYAPPHRSPLNVALLTAMHLGDFTLDVDVRQTGRDYGHRDLCFFFGWQAPDRFYYVHLATTPDANAHNVFLVDGAPRRNLLAPQAKGVDWGQGWHHVRLERTVADGRVRVFFDDLEHPVLEAVDTTLDLGRVGIGSFDDTGLFANAVIRARNVAYVQDGPEPFAR
jgi:hypothetical protein